MQTFNFEIQLTAFYTHAIADKKIKKHHISLYFALVMKWRKQKENPVIRIKAREMMPISDIGSRNAYFRYMSELVKWGYIAQYGKGLRDAFVVMKPLYADIPRHISISSDTDLSDLNNNKIEIREDQSSHAPSLEEVIAIYTAQGLTDNEATRFYSYYSRKGWKTKNGEPIKDWKSLTQVAVYRLLNKKQSSNDSEGKGKYQEPI
ncbi:hypothetical protein [Chitinophaga sp.]|uniref:hypothetical protein n=1 Tax=Chitinophaga sp. TaxID=1869181 RepID=UPI0031D159D4